MYDIELDDIDYTEWFALQWQRGKRAAKFQAEAREPLHRYAAYNAWLKTQPPRPRFVKINWYEAQRREYGISKMEIIRTARYCSCIFCSGTKLQDRRRARHRVRIDLHSIVATGESPDVFPLYEKQYLD